MLSLSLSGAAAIDDLEFDFVALDRIGADADAVLCTCGAAGVGESLESESFARFSELRLS